MSGDFDMSVDYFAHIDFQWQATTRQFMAEVIPTVVSELRSNAPIGKAGYGKTPGRFRESIGAVTYSHSSDSINIDFVSRVPYAPFVIYGTYSTRTIIPRTANSLRWSGANGDFVFAKSVKRKATMPNLFAMTTGEKLQSYLETTFSNSIVVTTSPVVGRHP